ncbi:MAG: hypothetical protein QUV20_15330 [Oceanibaculum nanhaiense]|uniref:hypothetical protein n=1 Tax=Oceanibaculum nanhaiense TaxID=1909734 RepID=UPI0025A3282B|nr:hypothetical protein [Oceanibaculum nanhaiense]MDM7947697.1 hypothetical protein [Oceanibaculum nanhaiense]
MITGVGTGEVTGAAIQPAARGASDRSAPASPLSAAGNAAADQPARPRAPGPTEVNGPQVWGNGYLSPVYRFDDSTSTLFFEQRAFVSGDTTRQVPLESAVKRYRLFEEVRQSPLPGQSGEDAGPGADQGVGLGSGQAVPASQAAAQDIPQEVSGVAQPPVAGVPGSGDAEPLRQQAGAPVGQVLDIVA